MIDCFHSSISKWFFFLFSDPSQGLPEFFFSHCCSFIIFFSGRINNLLVRKHYTLPLHKAYILVLHACGDCWSCFSKYNTTLHAFLSLLLFSTESHAVIIHFFEKSPSTHIPSHPPHPHKSHFCLGHLSSLPVTWWVLMIVQKLLFGILFLFDAHKKSLLGCSGCMEFVVKTDKFQKSV